MTDFEKFYENLTKYEDLEGKDIEDWLEDVKKGEKPEVKQETVEQMQKVHLENKAEEKSSTLKEAIEAENLDYENKRTIVEASTGELDIEDVSGVFRHPNGAVYVQGRDGKVVGTIDK